MLRLALLISGGGTTATAILRAITEKRLTGVFPVCVISSDPAAKGIERVQAAGLPQDRVFVLARRQFGSAVEFGAAMLKILQKQEVNLIGQYGWHVKTPANVVGVFPERMINQHPGPIDPGRPDFGGPGMFGRRVHCARLLFVRKVQRDFWTEATAQRVGLEYDQGAVLNKTVVPVNPDDDTQSLQERVLPIEHEVQIATLQDFADNNVHELKREEPLVRSGEESILAECKNLAALLYPLG